MSTAPNLKGKQCILSGLFSAKEKGTEALLAKATEKIEEQGGHVMGQLIQRRGVSRSKKAGGSKAMNNPINAKTLLGTGKANELAQLAETTQADTIVFLNTLSGTQKRALNALTRCEIIDQLPE